MTHNDSAWTLDAPKPTATRRVRLRTLVLGVAVLAVVAVLGRCFRDTLRRYEPLRTVYEAYYNYRYPWKSPRELGSGGDALSIYLRHPMGVARAPDGDLYISDRQLYMWRVDSKGKATVLAGNGRWGMPEFGVRANQTCLCRPEGFCFDRAGNLYMTDSHNECVFRIDPEGVIHPFAGVGRTGYSGDGGPATEARLNGPTDISVDSLGRAYIVDTLNHCIRRVDTDGIITTVVGDGTPGFSGDGGPASEAHLDTPWSNFVDPQDRLLVADSENNRIRRVDASGIITTIAGTGKEGYGGDDGPALQAVFDTPQALFVDRKGRIYIGDEHNHSIRVIDPDQTVHTLVGSGHIGSSEDGVPATSASLNDPEEIWVDPDGTVFFVEQIRGQVRYVTPDGILQSVAGSVHAKSRLVNSQ